MDWNSSALWGIIGPIVGGIITYFFMKHPVSKYKIIYKKQTSCLLSNTEMQNSGISVQHNTNNIDNLYLSNITIYNKGYFKITENEFVSNHNIKLFTDGQIFPYDSYTNGLKKMDELNDIEIKLEQNNQISINIRLLQPRCSFNFSFLHTDTINYSGELREGKIYEHDYKDDRYTIFSLLLLFNIILTFVNMNLSIENLKILCFFFNMFLLFIYAYFYNTNK